MKREPHWRPYSRQPRLPHRATGPSQGAGKSSCSIGEAPVLCPGSAFGVTKPPALGAEAWAEELLDIAGTGRSSISMPWGERRRHVSTPGASPRQPTHGQGTPPGPLTFVDTSSTRYMTYSSQSSRSKWKDPKLAALRSVRSRSTMEV